MTEIPVVELDYPKAVQLLTEVVAEKGRDYSYVEPGDLHDFNGSCDYWHKTRPGCLIGHALYRLGVPGEFLEGNEGSNAEALLDRLVYKYGWQVQPAVNWLFNKAQEMQDKRETWGFALHEAVNYTTDRLEEEE